MISMLMLLKLKNYKYLFLGLAVFLLAMVLASGLARKAGAYIICLDNVSVNTFSCDVNVEENTATCNPATSTQMCSDTTCETNVYATGCTDGTAAVGCSFTFGRSSCEVDAPDPTPTLPPGVTPTPTPTPVPAPGCSGVCCPNGSCNGSIPSGDAACAAANPSNPLCCGNCGVGCYSCSVPGGGVCQWWSSAPGWGCDNCAPCLHSRRAFIVFEDLDRDGVWEPNASPPERRISNSNSCTSANTQVVTDNVPQNFHFTFDGAVVQLDSDCNIGESEYTGAICTWDWGCNTMCSRWGLETNEIEATCFREAFCADGCDEYNECKGGQEWSEGGVCDQDINFCNGSNFDIKSGPVAIETRGGWVAVELKMPAGWTMSSGSALRYINFPGTSNNFCQGLTTFGVVRSCPAPSGLSMTGSCDASDGLLDIAVSWNAVAGATDYRLQVDDVNDFLTPELNTIFPSASICSAGVCRINILNLQPGTWYARVRVSAGCNPPYPWSNTASIIQPCSGLIEGNVYNDFYGACTCPGTGSCVGPTTESSGNFGTATTIPGGFSGIVDGTGYYQVPATIYDSYILSMTPADPAWQIICPGSGSYSPVSSPASGFNFFVSNISSGWFQAVNGDVHADGSLSADIPDTCDPFHAEHPCTPFFMVNSTGSSTGVVSSGASAPSISFPAGGGVSDTGWAANTTYQGDDFLFNYWRSKADGVVTYPYASLNQPPGEKGIYSFESSTDTTLSGNWDGIGYVATIFVNFTNDPTNRWLTLNPSNGITMGADGLLVIVTNGNIKIGDNVTQVEGIYLVDEEFNTCDNANCGYSGATAYPLTVRGTVVGWNSIDLQRDLSIANNYTPGETFIYEPSFIELLPSFFRKAIYDWYEVAP